MCCFFSNNAKKTRTHARTHKLTHAEKLVHVRTCHDILFEFLSNLQHLYTLASALYWCVHYKLDNL